MVKQLTFILACLWISASTSFSQKITLQNEAYQLEISTKSIEVSRVGQSVSEKLVPELTVFYTSGNPDYKRFRTKVGRTSVASWGEEKELWKSTGYEVVKASKVAKEANNKVIFTLKETANFSANLAIELPEGKGVPNISWEVTPKQAGWFSAGFTGLKPYDASKLDFLYQPLVWTWKRFPEKPYLTPEAFATTGASFITSENKTQGLHVHPKEVPFRYAVTKNSRFGIVLRTENSKAKPMIFAPILGGPESERKVGETYQFSVKYFMQEGDWQQGTNYLYEEVIEYRKERENATVSLNKTLENLVDFAMDDEYSGWIKEWKGCDYLQDVPGTVKNVSALHPLSLSLTMGSSEIYRKRALPMMEYMMSRQKYLFGVDSTIKYQSPSVYLKGPCAEIGELSGLHQMTNFQNDAFLQEIDRLFGKPRMLNLTTQTKSDSWQDYLARYKISRDVELLKKSVEKADAYLANHVYKFPVDFTSTPGLRDRQAYFVTDFGIRWFDLVELYEATQNKKYLDAAEIGAMEMLLWTRSFPFSDPNATHTFNKGGEVRTYSAKNRIKRSGITSPQEIDNFKSVNILPEQQVPAWRASFVGMVPESSYTYHLGSIMLTHHAAWMLRLAQFTGNKVLADAAYNAVVGRYANYPGYYFHSFGTNVFQRPDFPMKRFKDVNYNNIFYNHVWPQIALVQDFIITDAFYKSDGKVDFPSVYAPGYAFLTSKVYGHKAGRVYENENVNLWLPKDALLTTELALNQVWGWDEENTYLILTNTSDQPINTKVFVNPSVIPWNAGQQYKALFYTKEGKSSNGIFEGGNLEVSIPANGIQTIKLVGLKTTVPFQLNRNEANKVAATSSCGYFRKEHENKVLGTLTGMRLKMSGFDNVFVYTDAIFGVTQKVILEYKVGDYDWESAEDTNYPYEFSIPIFAKDVSVKVRWKAIDSDGKMLESEVFELCK